MTQAITDSKQASAALAELFGTHKCVVFFGGAGADGLAAAVFALALCLLQMYLPLICKNKVLFNFLAAFCVGSLISLACRARAAAPTGSSPISRRPAFLAMPIRCSTLSISALLHLLLQGVIHPVGHGGGKGPLQGPGFPRPLQALQIGADIGAPARLFPFKIQGDFSLRGLDHPDQLLLRLHLPAADALAHGYFLRHVPHHPFG